jgi:hypothetical protein
VDRLSTQLISAQLTVHIHQSRLDALVVREPVVVMDDDDNDDDDGDDNDDDE